MSFELETERLRLRKFTPDDADALLAVLGDPIAMQYYPAPYDRSGIKDWIPAQPGAIRGLGLWSVGDVAEALRRADWGFAVVMSGR